MSNSKDICYKKVYYEHDYSRYLIFEEIDINKLIIDEKDNNNNEEYIINIISHNLALSNHLDIYTPIIYNEKEKFKEAKKLKFFDKICFIPKKDYFIYEHLTDDKLIFHLTNFDEGRTHVKSMIVTRNNEIIEKFSYGWGDFHEIILDKKGIYFFEFFGSEYLRLKEKKIFY